MAKLSEEERQRRALARRRKQALAREEDAHRSERKHEEWERQSTRLSWEEYVAGVPCRGCGRPMSDGLGEYREKGTLYLAPEEKVRCDAEDARFLEQHGDCHAGRWSIGGSETTHCVFCCPSPPIGPDTARRLAEFFTSSTPHPVHEYDEWELLLTCDHPVRRRQHRSNGAWNNYRVVMCPACEVTRGIVQSVLIGPAVDDEQRPAVKELRLREELKEAEQVLARRRAAADKAQARYDEINARLERSSE